MPIILANLGITKRSIRLKNIIGYFHTKITTIPVIIEGA